MALNINTKKKQHTKSIVVVGFIIMALLCILGIILINKELINFSESSDTSAERRELVVTNNFLASFYKMESVGNLLIAELLPGSPAEYDSLRVETFAQIDSLRNVTNDAVIVEHLDSIKYLLDIKTANIQRMLSLLDSISAQPPKEVVKKTIVSHRDFSDLQDILFQSFNRINNVEDSVFVTTEKKSFMHRVKNIFSNASDSSLVVSKRKEEMRDSILVPVLVDTLTQYIQELSWGYESRHRLLTQRLIRRQNEMYHVNESMSSQINMILQSLKEREYETSMTLMNAKEATLRHSSGIVSIIGILASLTTLLFLIMTLTSISNSQRYRRRLENANKYAEDLLEARGRLILSITHDIKAPISSIIGYIELLSKDKLSEKERYYVENMQHSSEHILELVKNLLDYHSLESDKQDIQNMPFYPGILFKDIYQSFVPIAQKSDIEFRFECDLKETQSYESDPYRIRQICENLLSNAIKFTRATGKVLFSVSFVSAGEKTDLLFVSVKDTGPGISKENQEVIFDEFKRVDFHKGKIEGSGLGLTITKKLVSLLNGKISLISNLGEGSEFDVEIPLQKTEKKQFDVQDSSSDSTKIILNKEEKKILFIDDDIVQLNLYSELLKSEGFQTTICRNPLDALSLIQTSQFDLIFTDIQMPGMNGFELVERIRMGTFNGAKTLPVVALSASSKVSEQRFEEAGFSGFMPKPFTSESMLQVIHQFFGVQDYQCPSRTEGEEKKFMSLMEFAPEDPEAGKVIILSFIAESKKNIQIIHTALAGNNWEQIKKAAHKMLPLMRMISANELAEMLVEIEMGSKDARKAKKVIRLTENQLNEAEEFLKTI
ncbi:MAG: ATP-binding protein [Candidatus Azobacteroides sp.]|nr:ATP-binding protein [Candidatus Azobacteroides sp.]